jgi:hypothetical protein
LDLLLQLLLLELLQDLTKSVGDAPPRASSTGRPGQVRQRRGEEDGEQRWRLRHGGISLFDSKIE